MAIGEMGLRPAEIVHREISYLRERRNRCIWVLNECSTGKRDLTDREYDGIVAAVDSLDERIEESEEFLSDYWDGEED